MTADLGHITKAACFPFSLMRIPFIVAALLLAAAPLRAEEGMVFCFEGENVRPWRTADGKGLNFELLDRVAKRTGYRFRYLPMPWKRCLQDLQNGAVDGALAASFRPERRAFANYPGGETPDASKHLHIDRYVVVRRKGSGVEWDGKAFHGLKTAVGAQFHYSVVGDLKEAGIPVDDGAHGPLDVLRKLLHGRVDAVAALAGEAEVLVKGKGEFAPLEILPKPFVEKPYYLIMSHATMAQRKAAAEAVWDAIPHVRNGKDYKALEKAAFAEMRKAIR